MKEYMKRRIEGIVNDECKKRIMDLTTVTLSVASSTVIPFCGVAVVVAATVMQCLNFSVTLGLIPLLNVRSFSDLTSMSSQIGITIKRASKSSLMAGVETAVLGILKDLGKSGLNNWLRFDLVKDILVEIIVDSVMNVAWIMTPILAVPKYMLHRHLIKKMYRKLGAKAHIVHHTWTEQNCVHIEAQTTVVALVQLDGYENALGTYLQEQEVAATQAGAQVSQTNAYFQQQDGGVGQAQVSQTNYAYFQSQKGDAGHVQVSQTDAYFQQQSGGAGEAQVSQTNACFQGEGAADVEVSQTIIYFQPPNEGTGQAEVSQTNAYIKQQSEVAGEAQVSYTNAFLQPQSEGVAKAQVLQPSASFQSQAPPQKPWLVYQPSSQFAYTKPAAGMVLDYPQGPIVQPTSNSNPLARKNSTLIMGYSPPKNSYFFQPQVQPQVTGHNICTGKAVLFSPSSSGCPPGLKNG